MNNEPHIIIDKELRRDIDAIIQRLKSASTFAGGAQRLMTQEERAESPADRR